MTLENWDSARFTREFEQEAMRAVKRAGRKTGVKIRKEARKALGRVDPVRKKRINFKIARRTGTLVVKDKAPDARIREYGATIRAQSGKGLRIDFDKSTRGDPGDFIARAGSDLLIFRGEGDDAQPIAILKRRVRRRAAPQSKRLSKIAQQHIPFLSRQIEEELVNGR